MSNPVTPLNPQQTAIEEAKAQHQSYPVRVAEAFDVDINVDTDGLQDETLSARFGRWAKNYKGVRGFIGRLMCRGLNLFQDKHCSDAAAGAVGHAENVINAEVESGLIDQPQK